MTLQFDGQLLLVGAGKMGMALLEGFLRNGLPSSQVVVQDPAPTDSVKDRLRALAIPCGNSADGHLSAPPAVLLLAVKPQMIDAVLPTLKTVVGPDTLVVSVLAGKPLARFESGLGETQPVVRAMPNTPASVGAGMTVCVANNHVSTAQRAQADAIFATTGEVAWVDDEVLMDAVTSVSGSGPAYVFLLAEAMTEAGIEVGLEPELAARLARTTIAGAGQLLAHSYDDAAALRKAVTSPGGTTAAALQILMEKSALKSLMTEAVQAAKKRSEDLAG